ncbi:hypothetical protein ACFQ7O_35655 [Streptomyces sp. NPDC056485]|uniref:hypothetical protein n=1 Tax=Streptomyces sp. NPDC056485 TaxID=3345834 RepID=UPI0036B29404
MTTDPNAQGRHGIERGTRLPFWDEATHLDLAAALDDLAVLAAQLRAPVRDRSLRLAQYSEAHGHARYVGAVADSLRDELTAEVKARAAKQAGTDRSETAS